MAISKLVGVYDANGGLLGDDLAQAVAAAGAPVVLGRVGEGWRELVAAAELDEMAGSVSALEVVLRRHLEDAGAGGA